MNRSGDGSLTPFTDHGIITSCPGAHSIPFGQDDDVRLVYPGIDLRFHHAVCDASVVTVRQIFNMRG